MNFSEALDAMKRGEKVTRKEWLTNRYLFIDKEDNTIKFYDDLSFSEDEKISVALITSYNLLANDWCIKTVMPKIGDIVQVKGTGKGIITKCRVDGKYTVLIGDGSFLVCDMFNFDLTGENYHELVDGIRDFLH